METPSFAELYEQKSVTAAELKAVLKDYGEGGAAISSRVVIEIARHIDLTRSDIEALVSYARSGEEFQSRNRHSRDAQQYQEVIRYLNQR